jgi:hypothetical protein
MRLLLSMLLVLPLFAQPPQQEGRGPGGGPPPPKNLKVLKVEPQQLMPVMRSYTAALGVRCDFCHVQGDFAADDKRNKETARMMIQLVRDINGKFGNADRERVTCYTCHHGEAEPKNRPPAPETPKQ